MRTHHVNKARKDQGNCESCGKPITAGMGYKYVSPRYGGKRKRHTDCPGWRPSELTGAKIATAYAAQEGGHDSIDALEKVADWSNLVDDLKSILGDVAAGGNDCAADYQDGIDNMPDALQEGYVAEESREKIDTLESWASDLESWEPDDEPPTAADLDPNDAEDPDDALAELLETWAADVITSAREAIDALEL